MLLLWLSCLCLAAVVQGGKLESFIIGGREVYPPGMYPFQCALYGGGATTPANFYCGCVVVSSRHILTAAHCVGDPFPSYNVLVGAHDRETQKQGQPEWYALSGYAQHENWTNSGVLGFPNDVAVLTLNRDIDPANVYVDDVAVAPSGDEADVDFVGQQCKIIGWGQTSGTGSPANILQEANIDVITNAQCASLWTDRQVRDGHICAYDTVGQNRGSCFGDSGGALICKVNAEDQWTLAGLMSWLRSSCETTYPSVYTRVSFYRDWVEEQIGPLPLLVKF